MPALFALLALAACGAHQRDVETARSATYDGEHQQVFDAVHATVMEHAPKLDSRPTERVIHTAWREVASETLPDEGRNRLARYRRAKRNFVRFEVTLAGGPPWRVNVVGFASTWSLDAARPTPIPEDQRPGWLDAQEDALVLAVHRRLTSCCAHR